jgi:hypothetical protein
MSSLDASLPNTAYIGIAKEIRGPTKVYLPDRHIYLRFTKDNTYIMCVRRSAPQGKLGLFKR